MAIPLLVRASNIQFHSGIESKTIFVLLHSTLSVKTYWTNRVRSIDIITLKHQSFNGVALSIVAFRSVYDFYVHFLNNIPIFNSTKE